MFYGRFEGKNDICREFEIDQKDLVGCRILFAAYDRDYDGNALVVFRKKRRLYEVNGSHCSCFGLEGQWDPEETTVKALRQRIEKGTLRSQLGEYDAHFRAMLDRLSRKRPIAQS